MFSITYIPYVQVKLFMFSITYIPYVQVKLFMFNIINIKNSNSSLYYLYFLKYSLLIVWQLSLE